MSAGNRFHATSLAVSAEAGAGETLCARSVSGREWCLRPVNARDAETIAQKFGVERAVADILAGRGIALEDVEAHLTPSLRQSMPDPFVLQDMEKAVARLARAIGEGEKIGIFGDYDVDGTTSAALLARYFNALQVTYEVYLPDRITEGYGPNLAAFRYLHEKGASLCLTVDCGAMAHDILEQVKQDGLDVIVVDHHQMTLPPPPVVATVNPNRPDDVSGLTNLSAAGVTFMVLVALNRALRQAGYFADKPEPPIIQWLDLVALGLVCDVMPLTGLTRVLVAQGLKTLGSFREDTLPARYPGLHLLARQAKASGAASAYHLGFSLGPRINAAGRIGHASLAFSLMSEESDYKSTHYAQKLDLLNQERQEIESNVLSEAIAQIEARSGGDSRVCVIAAGAGWHPGVIGIVAGRLKEKYDCPAFVITLQDGLGKGSARSVAGLDLGAIVAAAKRADLLTAGGGHAMAAGLTIPEENLPAFQAFVESAIKTADTDDTLWRRTLVDSVIGLPAISRALADTLAKGGPYGQGYPEPKMLLRDVMIRYADIKAGKHIACTLADPMGNTARAIAFRCVGEPIGEALLQRGGKFQLIGKVKADEWRGGNAAQFIIEDLAEMDA